MTHRRRSATRHPPSTAASDPCLPLLGGLSASRFMQRYWHRRPLCIRGAIDPASIGAMEAMAASPGAPAAERIDLRLLRRLAADPDVESRLVRGPGFTGRGRADAGRWRLDQGPFGRLPPVSAPAWSLLVQGVDLHVDSGRLLLDRFRFVSDARLDDLMISFASDGGGVGAHVDSYDVFLLQLEGRRHWSVAPPRRGTRSEDGETDPTVTALRHLAHFEPTERWLLGPGDMLYLPPGWGHDGVAVGPCLTASIGFRSPTPMQWLSTIHEMIEDEQDEAADRRPAADRTALTRPFRDTGAEATTHPGAVPATLAEHLLDWQRDWRPSADLLERALGRLLTEPKPQVWFEANEGDGDGSDALGTALASGVGRRGKGHQGEDRFSEQCQLRLDRRSRMLYRGRYVFINGESVEPPARARRWLQRFADHRVLDAADLAKALRDPWLRATLTDWLAAGWIHGRT